MSTIIQFHPVTDDTELGDLSELSLDEISQVLNRYNNLVLRTLKEKFPECEVESTPGNGMDSFTIITDLDHDDFRKEDQLIDQIELVIQDVFENRTAEWFTKEAA